MQRHAACLPIGLFSRTQVTLSAFTCALHTAHTCSAEVSG